MSKIFFLLIIFINAFVDIGHKITLQNIAFKLYDGNEQIIFVSIINALILLPFIFLFSPSGFISDKFPKDKVMKYGALSAVFISFGLLLSYYFGLFYLSFLFLFLLATQSAFYSPAKFGYIKSLYGENNLAVGNSYAQAVGTISILISMAIFSFYFENLYSTINDIISSETILQAMLPISISLFCLTILEFLFTLTLPSFENIKDNEKFSIKEYFKLNLLKENISKIKDGDGVFLSIIGLSVFYAVVQGIFTIFPAYAKEYLNINDTLIINGMIAIAGLGIVFGALFYSRYSKHFIEVGTIPIASFFMTVILFFIIHSSNFYFLFFLFFSFGFMGGLFIIPLNSLIQFNTSSKNLGSVLAGNNWFQSLAMFLILIVTTIFSIFNINSLSLLYILFGLLIIGSIYTLYKLPQSLIQFLLSRLVKHRYKVIVNGVNNIPSSGPILFLGNHISFLDWAILQISSPRRIRFVMDKAIYNKWYFHYFLKFFGAIPISGAGSKDSLKTISDCLNNGDAVCIFPEGKISRNGHIGEFKKGYELVLEMVDVDVAVIPFYLQGLWGTIFARSNEYYVKNIDTYFEVSCTFGKPLHKNVDIVSLKKYIFDLSVISWNKYLENSGNLQEEIVCRAKKVGSKLLMADSTGMKLSGYKTLGLAITLRNTLQKMLIGQNIGLIVPSTVIGNISNLSLLMLGKTLVNLNYTSSIESLISSIELAEIKTLIVSKKFISKIKSKGFDLDPLLNKVEKVIYLEDLKPNLSKLKIFTNILKVYFLPTNILNFLYSKKVNKENTAVILFSSGSEGTPKGIELTHSNLLSNVKQISTVLEANENDVILGNLPIFHAFGLTVTTLLPMVEGIPVVSHPDPTDGFGIGKLVSTYNATIMCGTSTFIRLYTNNRKVQPLMFDSLRIVISGAEKLDSKVREKFRQKFGKEIYEGYGATETSPVAAVNIPDRLEPSWKIQVGNKYGTVGLPLPGTSIKIVDPADLEKFINSEFKGKLQDLPVGEDGMILIGGPQIMKGYYKNPEKTLEVLIKYNDINWYVSGDKGHVDENGFLTIVDRYSRFAKLGGEMISLTSVENKISEILNLDNFDCIAINVSDDKKGEKIILIYDNKSEFEDIVLIKKIKSGFDNKLMLPSEFIKVDELPKLGSGKKDFKTAKQLYLNGAFK